MKARIVLVVAAVAVGSFFLGAWAQEKGDAGMMMKPEWTKLTEHHKKLAESCGEFDVDFKMWMIPGAPPAEIPSTAKRKMIMNGNFLQEDFSCNFEGQPYKGRLIQGYDTIAKEYVAIWIDNMSPYMAVMRGTEKDGIMTQRCKTPDPMTGELKNMRSVVKTEENGQIVFSSYVSKKGEEEQQNMKMVYKRKGGGK